MEIESPLSAVSKHSNFGGNQRGRGRGRYDKSPNIRRPRIASKTVDKTKVDVSTVIEYGHFIRECSKKKKMRNPEDIVEWTLITIRKDSIQIMMILVFILMTMMMKYLPL